MDYVLPRIINIITLPSNSSPPPAAIAGHEIDGYVACSVKQKHSWGERTQDNISSCSTFLNNDSYGG